MGSKSASTSPTSSVHSTPTHQAKPSTLDPFADLGNLGSGLGGKGNVWKSLCVNTLWIRQVTPARFHAQVDQDSPANPPHPLVQAERSHPWAPPSVLLPLRSTPPLEAGIPVLAFLHGNLVGRVSGNLRTRAHTTRPHLKHLDRPCLTPLHRTDQTTTSASPAWVERHPGALERKRSLTWVSD